MCFDQNWNFINNISYAEVVKLVDTSDSKSDDREVVGVRVPLSAPKMLILLLKTYVEDILVTKCLKEDRS